jgi:hypothetical protein
MKPTDPILLLAAAIATQENNPGTNPGNLHYAGQFGAHCPRCGMTMLTSPTCKSTAGTFPAHTIAEFVDRKRGILALRRQILMQFDLGQTIPELIAQYAPPGANDTTQYVANVLSWTGLPADVPIIDLIPDLEKLN